MSEPTAHIAARRHHHTSYCSRCDLLVGLDGLHVTVVEFDREVGLLTVRVESARAPMGCTSCGVVAHSDGRSDVTLVDAPCFDRPVRLIWRKRTWRCEEPSCPTKVFTEQDEQMARPRALLTVRACWWAINQTRREHASIAGIARQLGTTWNTVWTSIEPLLQAMADLTPDEDGKPRARLLDLVPGRSGKAYSDWLEERGDDFKNGVEVATLDPFHGYKNAIDDQLEDAVAVLDAFHVVKLGTQAVDEVRRRVQQEIHGHRGPKNDPLYGIRTILRCGQEKLTERQRARLDRAIVADERHDEVLVAWLCTQQLRSAYKAKNPVEGRRIAEKVLASLPTCPIPEIKRLGKTLKQWREAFLAYFDTGRANNGGTEAINGLIELHRRVARGFRNREHYRLRMLLIGGGLSHPHLR